MYSHQSPSGPVYTRKTLQVFRIYKTDLNMKTHFKTTWRQRLRAPSRTNLRWYIVHHPQLPTLPSRKQTSLWRPAQQECTSQGAPLISPTVKKQIPGITVPPVPFWSCLHQKNTTSFSYLLDCLIWTWKHISKLPGEKGYAYFQNESWTIIAHQECISQGAPTYPYFSKPLKIYVSVPPTPFWSCLHQKTLPGTFFFRIYKDCLI